MGTIHFLLRLFFFFLTISTYLTAKSQSLSSRDPPTGSSPGSPVWGVHVRHGDVKSRLDLYGGRRVYDFETYLTALTQQATRETRGKNRKSHPDDLNPSVLPRAVYISTDSAALTSSFPSLCDWFESKWGDDDDMGDEGDDMGDDDDDDDDDNAGVRGRRRGGNLQNQASILSDPPCLFTARPKDRYRTNHGSHTVR